MKRIPANKLMCICSLCKESKHIIEFIQHSSNIKHIVIGICNNCYITNSKKCCICEEQKKINEFVLCKSRTDGIHSFCYKCQREKMCKALKEDTKYKEYTLKYSKEYYRKNLAVNV